MRDYSYAECTEPTEPMHEYSIRVQGRFHYVFAKSADEAVAKIKERLGKDFTGFYSVDRVIK